MIRSVIVCSISIYVPFQYIVLRNIYFIYWDVDSMSGRKMDQESSHTIYILMITGLLCLLLFMILGLIQKVGWFSLLCTVLKLLFN